MHPFSAAPERKSRFVQSKWERLKISKYREALRKGWMKTLAQKQQEREEREAREDAPWDVWRDESLVSWRPRRMPKPITAPKRDLPGHAESFNPPEEYLFDEQERKEWNEAEEEDRRLNFVPQSFDALRRVPLYENLIKEHFERCLDLYMCPRLFKKKLSVSDPRKLLPELPNPSDLKPFPTRIALDFLFHTGCVRALALSPDGAWLASGDEANNLVIFNAKTAKVVRRFKLPNRVVDALAWCPSTERCLLAVANEETVHFVAPALYGRDANQATTEILAAAASTYAIEAAATSKSECTWDFSDVSAKQGSSTHCKVTLTLKNVISKVAWHPKGDYLATMAAGVQTTS